MARRSQMEILMSILEAVNDRKWKPTNIMYRANVPWNRLQKHLALLVNQGLLEEKETGKTTIYTMTMRGSEVLGYFKKIQSELCRKRRQPTEIYIQNTMIGNNQR